MSFIFEPETVSDSTRGFRPGNTTIVRVKHQTTLCKQYCSQYCLAWHYYSLCPECLTKTQDAIAARSASLVWARVYRPGFLDGGLQIIDEAWEAWEADMPRLPGAGYAPPTPSEASFRNCASHQPLTD